MADDFELKWDGQNEKLYGKDPATGNTIPIPFGELTSPSVFSYGGQLNDGSGNTIDEANKIYVWLQGEVTIDGTLNKDGNTIILIGSYDMGDIIGQELSTENGAVIGPGGLAGGGGREIPSKETVTLENDKLHILTYDAGDDWWAVQAKGA